MPLVRGLLKWPDNWRSKLLKITSTANMYLPYRPFLSYKTHNQKHSCVAISVQPNPQWCFIGILLLSELLDLDLHVLSMVFLSFYLLESPLTYSKLKPFSLSIFVVAFRHCASIGNYLTLLAFFHYFPSKKIRTWKVFRQVKHAEMFLWRWWKKLRHLKKCHIRTKSRNRKGGFPTKKRLFPLLLIVFEVSSQPVT